MIVPFVLMYSRIEKDGKTPPAIEHPPLTKKATCSMIPAKLQPENVVDSSAAVDPETSGHSFTYIVTNYARNGSRMLQAVADVLSKRCIRAPSCNNVWYCSRICSSFVCPFWGLTLSQCVVTKMRFFIASCPPTSLNLS